MEEIAEVYALAAARIDGKWGFIDRKGVFVMGPEYDQV